MRATLLVGTLALSVAVWGAPLAAQTSDAAALKAEQQELEKQKVEQERAERKLRQEVREAERKMREAEREIEAASRRLAELEVDRAHRQIERSVVVFDDHARLGIILRTEQDEGRPCVGAVIDGLTPGGPAAEAGLKADDTILSFNGKSLLDGGADTDDDECPASARLSELVTSLNDGDQVKIEYLRGKEKRSTTVTARRLRGPRVRVFSRPERVHVDEGGFAWTAELPELDELHLSSFGQSWHDLELVELNPELGEYFGAKEGLLVVSAPASGVLELKSGDVIVSISDRAPRSPAQALRILHSYETGETVTIEVVRKHQKLALEAKVPERKRGFFITAPPAPPAPPAPAAPPAAPAPPAPPAKEHHSSV